MELTAKQRKTLLRYRELRDRPRGLARHLVPVFLRFLMGLAFAVGGFLVFPPLVPWFLVTFVLGAFVREVALTVQARRIFPAFLEIIDWAKVDQLLGEQGRPTDPGGA